MKKQSETMGQLLEGERYADWNYVFDGDLVPLAADKPSYIGNTDVYPIDHTRLRPVQTERLAELIIKRLDVKRADAFAKIRQGFFIRAEDVKVVKAERNFL